MNLHNKLKHKYRYYILLLHLIGNSAFNREFRMIGDLQENTK